MVTLRVAIRADLHFVAPAKRASHLQHGILCASLRALCLRGYSVTSACSVRDMAPSHRFTTLHDSEHQFVNLPHLQHHTARLSDRVSAATGHGLRWVGAKPPRAGR